MTQNTNSGFSGYLQKTFTSFDNSVYRLYYFSMVGHWSSLNMQMLVRNLLVFRITGSGAVIGILALSHAIPMIFFTLPGGVWADRIQKKTVIQIGQLISIFVSLGTTIALFIGYLSPAHPESWWVLAVSGFFQGAMQGIIMPSRTAIISEIVKPHQLMNAISLNNLGMNVFRIASPALAGFLVDVVDFWVVYAIMSGLIIMSWVLLLFVPETSQPRKSVHTTTSLEELVEGWNYIKQEKTLFTVLIFCIIALILGSPYSQLIPMFTEDPDILNISATGMGLLVMVSGVGAISGSLILASLSNKGRGKILLFAVQALSISLIIFAFSRWLALSMAVIVIIGFGSTIQMALGNSLIQYYVKAEYRGRVMSFLMLGFGLGSLGSFLAGIMAEGIGVQWAVGGLAMFLLAVTLFMTAAVPRLRKMD